MHSRLVIVSSRVPSRSNADNADGPIVALRAALDHEGSVESPSHAVWFGWSGRISEDGCAPLSVRQSPKVTFVGVDLTSGQYRGHFNFSTKTMWPLLHELADRVQSRSDDLLMYRTVSELFAQRLRPMLLPDDQIWVHDHHLIPVGRMLRQAGVADPIGFFLNTPFPPADSLAGMPWQEELAADLAAYDLVGFQSHRDEVNFKEFMRHARHGRAEGGGAQQARAKPFTGVFPVGIHTRSFIEMASAADIQDRVSRLARSFRGKQLIITADRLDHTRGLLERLAAFERLLDGETSLRAKACMVQITAPPRERMPGHLELRRKQQALAQRINSRFLTFGWVPIYDMYGAPNHDLMIALYRLARAGLATPLRDGMNLAAKEYVAAQNPRDPGVLILSRFAGAADMLFEALIVDPHDVGQVTNALAEALRMPLDERQDRWRRMIVKLLHHDAVQWHHSFLCALAKAHGRRRPVASPVEREPAWVPRPPISVEVEVPGSLDQGLSFQPSSITLAHIPLPSGSAAVEGRR